MKKILSTLLVVAMIVSMFAVFSIPAAAVDGVFDTHGRVSQEAEDYDGDINSIPGYVYTNEGLHMTAADWTTGTPFSHVSTKEKVDLKQGVYMQVRIDSFEYGAKDKWVNFNLWSLPAIDEGSGDEAFGTGVQTLMRPSNGGFGTVSWYTKSFSATGSSSMSEEGKKIPADGKNVLTLKVTYDGTTFAVEINGAVAPQKVIDYMNTTYAEDSFAYVGFTMYSDAKGGTQEATVLKYGTSEANATVPQGDDDKDPENYYIEYADLGSADDIDEGEPAILMSGDKEYSDLKGTPTSNIGAKISISDELLVHVIGSKELTDCGVWKVDNDVSYDIVDFPVMLIMTKNFCSCGTGVPGECYGFEEAALYVATGENLVPNSQNKVSGLATYTDPCFIGDDGYVFFIKDLSSETGEDGRFNGRINSTRVDFTIDINSGIAGANEFDVVMQGFFASVEDAANYAMAYLEDNGYESGEDGEEETTAPAEEETTAPAEEETTAKAEETTQAPEQTTAAPVVDTTEATTEASEEETTEESEEETTKAPEQTTAASSDDAAAGCFGTVGMGAIAIVAIAAAAGFVSFKKKD